VRCGSPTLGRFDSCAAPLRREVRLALRASHDDFAAIVFRSGPQGPHPAKPDAAADGWTGSMKDRLALAMIEGAERTASSLKATPSSSTRAEAPVPRAPSSAAQRATAR
jgi:hypothetical protein